jgi:hypothetical protein
MDFRVASVHKDFIAHQTLGFYAAWRSQSGKVKYTRFRTYEALYIISISSAVAIAVVYLILWKKEGAWRKIGEIVKRLFGFGYPR